MRVLVACVVALLFTGCAQPIVVNAFSGPAPSEEIAVLHLGDEVRLLSVDGAPVPGLPAGLTETDSYAPRIVRLLPGEHTIVAGIRPRVQTYSSPNYMYIPSGDCHGGGSFVVTSYNSYTSSLPGSRENETIRFIAQPARTYRLKIDDPPDWFSKTQRWSARIIEKTDQWSDPIVSTSLGRQPHETPPSVAFENGTAPPYPLPP